MLGARRLAMAIGQGNELALLRYWRERDVLALPLHFDAQRLGEVGFNNALTRLLLRRAGQSAELSARFALVNDRRISPSEAVGTLRLARWVLSDVVRGRFEPLTEFLRTGRRMAGWQRELAARRQLLADLDVAMLALPQAPPQLLSEERAAA
jgi:hypothetical protein